MATSNINYCTHSLGYSTSYILNLPFTSFCACSRREGAVEEWQWSRHDCWNKTSGRASCKARNWPHPPGRGGAKNRSHI